MLTQARQTTLIATLGTEPQVVSVTLDLLVEQGIEFDQVIVIHTATDQPLIRAALQSLADEFDHGNYHASVRHYTPILLQTVTSQPISDIYSEVEAGAVFTLLYRQVLEQKRKNRIVHLNIAGGRKGMMIFGMAAAQILFDDDDRLWLLSSSKEFAESRALHRRMPTDAQLIPIPVLRWNRIPASISSIIVNEDPFQAIRQQSEMIAETDHRRKEQFLSEHLHPTERRIAEELVREAVRGNYLSNEQIGESLGYATKTIEHYLSNIYSKARNFFALREDMLFNREVLVALLASYLEWVDRAPKP